MVVAVMPGAEAVFVAPPPPPPPHATVTSTAINSGAPSHRESREIDEVSMCPSLCDSRAGRLSPQNGLPKDYEFTVTTLGQLKMARTKFTRQEAKQRTRKRLLDAARRLILAGGEARLTASNVARRAGVAGATFYEHFRNRDDLLRALSNDLFDELRGKLRRRRREALAAPYDEDKLREQFRTPLEILAANPDLFRLALRVRHHPTSPLGDSSRLLAGNTRLDLVAELVARGYPAD